MFEHAFADPRTLILGALTGLIFGFLLQKGGVASSDTIMRQMTLRDFTVAKMMLTAIVVGAIGVWIMKETGMIKGLHLKPALLAANAIGGAIFGVGMAVAGYCPGTSFAALGQKSWDAIPATAGMIVGVVIFAQAYPWLAVRVLPIADLGKKTLPDVTGVPWWVYVLVLSIGLGVMARALARKPGATPAL
jgi:uncharacterized membrane protein YedE/YeeE